MAVKARNAYPIAKRPRSGLAHRQVLRHEINAHPLERISRATCPPFAPNAFGASSKSKCASSKRKHQLWLIKGVAHLGQGFRTIPTTATTARWRKAVATASNDPPPRILITPCPSASQRIRSESAPTRVRQRTLRRPDPPTQKTALDGTDGGRRDIAISAIADPPRFHRQTKTKSACKSFKSRRSMPSSARRKAMVNAPSCASVNSNRRAKAQAPFPRQWRPDRMALFSKNIPKLTGKAR